MSSPGSSFALMHLLQMILKTIRPGKSLRTILTVLLWTEEFPRLLAMSIFCMADKFRPPVEDLVGGWAMFC